jgi:hypothetical protein
MGKAKNFATVILVMFAMSFLSSCANNVYSLSYSSINKEYEKQLDQVALGMTKEELKGILPNTHLRGSVYVGKEVVEALELEHSYWSGVGGYLVKDKLWFYFHDGKLMKWGKPEDWPQKPDLVIENHSR